MLAITINKGRTQVLAIVFGGGEVNYALNVEALCRPAHTLPVHMNFIG